MRDFLTQSHIQHYFVWCVDINDGWSDNENLIVVGGPMDLEVVLIAF